MALKPNRIKSMGGALPEYALILGIVVVFSIGSLMLTGEAVDSRLSQLACMFLGGSTCGSSSNGGDNLLSSRNGSSNGGSSGGSGSGSAGGYFNSSSNQELADYVDIGGASGSVERAVQQLKENIERLKKANSKDPRISRLKALMEAGKKLSSKMKKTEDSIYELAKQRQSCSGSCKKANSTLRKLYEKFSRTAENSMVSLRNARSDFLKTTQKTLTEIKDDPPLSDKVVDVSDGIDTLSDALSREANEAKRFLDGEPSQYDHLENSQNLPDDVMQEMQDNVKSELVDDLSDQLGQN